MGLRTLDHHENMSRFASATQDSLIFGVLCLHVWLAPHTKVEESFNLHATHDILLHGLSPSALKDVCDEYLLIYEQLSPLPQFDHFTFPGPIPRSFVGSLILSTLARPIILASLYFGACLDKPDTQLLALSWTSVRFLLALSNGIGFSLMRRMTSRQFGWLAGWLFTLFTISQYHLPFWAGRTLPNMFALFPAIVAYSNLSVSLCDRKVAKSQDVAIGLLVFCAVVLRGEIVLLLGPICLQLLLNGTYTISRLFIVGIKWGMISLAITVCVDSYFWDTWPLWPELNGIIFNVIQGNSSEWGTSPVSTYFKAFLPKLLLATLPFTLLGIALDKRIRRLTLPCSLFIALLSGLGHKEWRFIVYTIPVFNVAAAHGACRFIQRSSHRVWRFVATAVVLGTILLNLVASAAFTFASTLNYPGGQALNSLKPESLLVQKNVTVFIDDLAAQTGATLFLQTGSAPFVSCNRDVSLQNHPWIYHKILSNSTAYSHLVVEDASDYLPPSTLQALDPGRSHFVPATALVQTLRTEGISKVAGDYTPVAIVRGFDRWGFDKSGESWVTRYVPIPFVTSKLWILKKSN